MYVYIYVYMYIYIYIYIYIYHCEQIVPGRHPRSQDTPMRPRTLRAGFPCILLHTIHGDATSDGDGGGGDVNIDYTTRSLHTYMHTYVPTYTLHTCMHGSPRKHLTPRTTCAEW